MDTVCSGLAGEEGFNDNASAGYFSPTPTWRPLNEIMGRHGNDISHASRLGEGSPSHTGNHSGVGRQEGSKQKHREQGYQVRHQQQQARHQGLESRTYATQQQVKKRRVDGDDRKFVPDLKIMTNEELIEA